MELINLIKEYYEKRGIVFPDFDSAIKFALTEIGEVLEVDLARRGNWVRNHPENKPKFDKELLSEELGDVIFMLVVAGITEGVDPIKSLLDKMKRKLNTVQMAGGNLEMVKDKDIDNN